MSAAGTTADESATAPTSAEGADEDEGGSSGESATTGGTSSESDGQGDGCVPEDCPPAEATRVVDICAGNFTSLALLDNGEVVCWGSSGSGLTGHGNNEEVGDDEHPVDAGPVPLPRRALSLSCGRAHACAVFDERTVFCWGSNSNGELGSGVPGNVGRDTPASQGTPLEFSAAVRTLGIGRQRTCVGLEGGVNYCFGRNPAGVLGIGDPELGQSSFSGDDPYDAYGPMSLTDEVKNWSGNGSTFTQCAVLANGQVRCWGKYSGYDGMIGQGYTPPECASENGLCINASICCVGDNEPVTVLEPVELGGPVEKIVSLGQSHCALLEGGDVRCWGSSPAVGIAWNLMPVGDDETPGSLPALDLGEPAVDIEGGSVAMCAVLASGAVRCWGTEVFGDIFTTTDEEYIGDDETPAEIDPIPLGEPATKVALGGEHACALLASGQVRCWGKNTFGQLGYPGVDRVGDDEQPADMPTVRIF